jgi:hypothetical protein
MSFGIDRQRAGLDPNRRARPDLWSRESEQGALLTLAKHRAGA